jgi:hypothetical protein
MFSVIAFATCFCGRVTHAQGSRGTLSGHVTDSSGATVSGADVTIINEATKAKVTAKTSSGGDYSLPGLNADRYTVSISHTGFRTFTENRVQVDVDQNTAVDAVLQLGSVSSEVTVQADQNQVTTTQASLGMTVEEKSMTDLPLIYGNPFTLENLAPGIVLSGVNPNLHVYDSGTASVSVNGSALNAIDYKLDGAADNRLRVSAFTPNTESISQYRMNTANYDATDGHSSGGFVNVQTKSGTDHFHGSIFEYYQNENINANVWLVNPLTTPQNKPTFQRFGGSIGGPILRRKVYFFGGIEHSIQGSTQVGSAQVPTTAEISGDFSALLALDKTAGAQTCGSTPTVLTGTINKYQLFDPTSSVYSPTTKVYSRLCIPGNNVANYTKISPVAKAALSYYHPPNGGAQDVGIYNYNLTQNDNYLGGAARFDYAASQRDAMYLRLERSDRYNDSSLFFPPVSGTHLAYQNYGAAFGQTFTLSPTLVINGVIGYTRFTNNNKNTGQGQVTPTSVGMPSYLTAGLPGFAQALPNFGLSGYTSTNTSSYTLGLDDIWLGNVTASKQLGAHFLRFGTEYRRYLTNGEPGTGENGSYSSSGSLVTSANGVNPAVTGPASVAEFEFGLINSGSQTQNSDYASRSDYWALFVQDDWRATRQLTVNLGLRWDHELAEYERNGKEIVAFNYNATNSATVPAAAVYASKDAGAGSILPSAINPNGGVAYANTFGYGKQPYSAPWSDIAPRVGFAYAINNKTVMRGGFGILFDSLQSLYISGMNTSGNPIIPETGYSQVSNVTAPVYANGTLTLSSTLQNPFPSGLTAITGNTAGYNTGLGQDIQYLEPNPHMPYNERFSFGFQRQLGQFLLSLDYVGNHGVHQPTQQMSMGTNYGGEDFNAVPNQYLSTITNGFDNLENYHLSTTTVPNPFVGLLPANSSNGLSSSNIGVAQLLRPRPEFGRIDAYEMNGTSMYHAAQVFLQRRFTNGLSTTAAFTWSRSLDAIYYLNPGDPRPWYGTSMNDRPLRFSTSGIYQLPWGHGRRWLSSSRGVAAQVIGGWQVQGVYQVQSGQPLTFTGNDVYYGTNPGEAHWSRSQYKSTVQLGSGRGGYWFNPANFLTSQTSVPGVHTVTCPAYNVSTPTLNTFCPDAFPGTYQLRRLAPRYNTLRADRLNQLDLGIQRQFQVVEWGTLQFRAEAINALNHPVYSAPASMDPTNSQFGQITSQANQPRVFQFAGFFRF